MLFGTNTGSSKGQLIDRERALPGRSEPMQFSPAHFVNGHSMCPPYPVAMDVVTLGLGCFWGAERVFWQLPGVYVTAAGYAGGYTPNPTYEEVCSGRTGHTEAVKVVFDPEIISLSSLLATFWEAHDPTQGMRQGNDIGTQYRSSIYTSSGGQTDRALASRDTYQTVLRKAGKADISTEIAEAGPFYYAEGYHQQYLAKNPGGYCGLGGCGIGFPARD